MNEAQFSIVLPKRDNSERPIKKSVHQKYAKDMSNHFGGVTIQPAVLGCYIGGNKKLQCEENVVLSSARDCKGMKPNVCSATINQDYTFIKKTGKKAARQLGQESIKVDSEVLNDVSFQEGTKKDSISPKLQRKYDYFERMI